MDVHVVLPCEHEEAGLLRAGKWSGTTSVEGDPPPSAEPHGWGISKEYQWGISVSAIGPSSEPVVSTGEGVQEMGQILVWVCRVD